MKFGIEVNKYVTSIKRRISKLSLQHKLIALYVLIIMIPIIIFTFYYSKDIYKRAIHEITYKNENALEIEKIHTTNNMEAMRRTAQLIISDMAFMDFVKTRNEANINDLINFKMNAFSNVSKLQFNNPSIENMRFYTTNPFITEMWPILFSETRIYSKPWRPEVLKRKGMEVWRFDEQTEDVLKRLPSQNTSKVSLFREVDYPKNEHLGIIEINMLLKNFFPKMFGEVKDSSSSLAVFDRNMNLIRNANNPFFEKEKIDLVQLKKKFIQHKKKSTNSFQFTNNKTPYLIISTYIDGLDCYMLNVISLQEIYAETAKTRNIILIGIVFLVIILSLVTYAMISLLLKKMYQLRDSVMRVENGDFSFEIDIKGHDEIGELAAHFKNMLRKIRSLIADAVNKQAAKKEVELKALKTQIDSHFLYNTLENIKMMAEIDGKYEISDAITSLGEMMRYNLRWKTDFVILEEELNHVKNYIDIMNLRLDGKLTLEIDVPDEILEQEILKMSLQPIVENAVKHGIRPIVFSKEGIIEITASYQGDATVITVKDNGKGMDQEKVDLLNKAIHSNIEEEVVRVRTNGNGIGLNNVNERFMLYYGTDYGLDVTSVEGENTLVKVKMPTKRMKGGSVNV